MKLSVAQLIPCLFPLCSQSFFLVHLKEAEQSQDQAWLVDGCRRESVGIKVKKRFYVYLTSLYLNLFEFYNCAEIFYLSNLNNMSSESHLQETKYIQT